MSKYRDNLNTGLNLQQSYKLAQIAKTAQQTKEIEQERLKIEEKRLEEQQRIAKEQKDREQEHEYRCLQEAEERETAIFHERMTREQEEKDAYFEKYKRSDPYILLNAAVCNGDYAKFINELDPLEYPARQQAAELFNNIHKEYENGNKIAVKSIIDDIYTNLYKRKHIFEKAHLSPILTIGINMLIATFLEERPTKSKKELFNDVKNEITRDPHYLVAFVQYTNLDIDQIADLAPSAIFNEAKNIIKHGIGAAMVSECKSSIQKRFANPEELLAAFAEDKKISDEENKTINEALNKLTIPGSHIKLQSQCKNKADIVELAGKEKNIFQQRYASVIGTMDEQKVHDKIILIKQSCEEVLNKVQATGSSDIIIPDVLNELLEDKKKGNNFIASTSATLSKLIDTLPTFLIYKPPDAMIEAITFLGEEMKMCEIMTDVIILLKEYSKYLTINNNDIVQEHLSIIQKFITSLDPESIIDVRAYNDDLVNAIAFFRTYKQNTDQFLIKAKSLESATYPLLEFYKQKAEAICEQYVKLLPTTVDGNKYDNIDIIDHCRCTALLLCNFVEEYDNNCQILNTFCSSSKELIVDTKHLPHDLIASLQYIKSKNQEINNSLKEIAAYSSAIPLASYWNKQAKELIKTGNSAIASYDALPKNTIPKLAVASFVCGLCAMILSILTGIPAIIMGHIALAKRKHNRGKGLAITGLILGYLSVVWLIIMLLIPNK